jgi:hypothetical protein
MGKIVRGLESVSGKYNPLNIVGKGIAVVGEGIGAVGGIVN